MNTQQFFIGDTVLLNGKQSTITDVIKRPEYGNKWFYSVNNTSVYYSANHLTLVKSKKSSKNIRFMTTKEKLSRFRNLTKGLLIRQKDSIQNNILFNLPEGCKSLSDDEMEIIRRIKADYNSLIASWDYRTKELLNKINNNI